MDISASQWSSGCESGWTRYLNQSVLSENQFHGDGGTEEYRRHEGGVEQKEEDLSLVSDASSGPSHYHEDDEESFHDTGCHFSPSSVSKSARKSNKNKKKAKEHGRRRGQSNLDDTASSPAWSLPQADTALDTNKDSVGNLLNFSQGFSAKHFEGNSAYQKHFGLFKSSFSEKPASEEPGRFQGRNWK